MRLCNLRNLRRGGGGLGGVGQRRSNLEINATATPLLRIVPPSYRAGCRQRGVVYEGLPFVGARWKLAGRRILQCLYDGRFSRAVRTQDEGQRAGEAYQRVVIVVAEVTNAAKRQPPYFGHVTFPRTVIRLINRTRYPSKWLLTTGPVPATGTGVPFTFRSDDQATTHARTGQVVRTESASGTRGRRTDLSNDTIAAGYVISDPASSAYSARSDASCRSARRPSLVFQRGGHGFQIVLTK